MSEWISIKNKFPNNGQDVIVTNGKRIATAWVEVTEHDYVFMASDHWHQIKGITHWMFLPELPK